MNSRHDKPTLSLRELDEFDAAHTKRPRRLCPFCGRDKPRDAAHCSLSVNAHGLWQCFRCQASGKLREFWPSNALESPSTRREHGQAQMQARAEIARVFGASEAAASQTHPTSTSQGALMPPQATQSAVRAENDHEPQTPAMLPWTRHLEGVRSLRGTIGENYLLRERGFPASDFGPALVSGVEFAPRFYGRPALAFPLRDRAGTVVAAHGRFVDGKRNPPSQTAGPKSDGLFSISGALDQTMPAILITEAPLDALSLAVAGYPAVALCGTSGPDWLRRECAYRRVLLGFDADAAGDVAASNLAQILAAQGAKCQRLRPEPLVSGTVADAVAKDWNDLLQAHGRDALADWLAARVLPECPY